MSWTDLRDALLPQGLAKTGVIAGFLGSLDPKRIDPEVLAVRDAAYSGNLGPVLPFAAARASLPALKGVKTPVFMMQGRRDFAFGMEHALQRLPRARRAEAALVRAQRPRPVPRRRGGHAARCSPRARAGSTGTSAATPPRRWRSRCAISPESWTGQPVRFAAPAEGHADEDGARRRRPRSPSPGSTGGCSRGSPARPRCSARPSSR